MKTLLLPASILVIACAAPVKAKQSDFDIIFKGTVSNPVVYFKDGTRQEYSARNASPGTFKGKSVKGITIQLDPKKTQKICKNYVCIKVKPNYKHVWFAF